MSSYGIQATGFVPKTFDIIQSEVLNSIESAIGKIRKDAKSKIYQFNEIYSEREVLLWQAAAALYAMYSVDAEGTALDELVARWGTTRLAATYSTVNVTFTGVDTTVIPAGTIAKVDLINGAQFVSLTEAVISGTTATVLMMATEIGSSITAPAGTLSVLVSTVTGITSVTNSVDATPGRDTETDDSLRFRFNTYLRSYPGKATYNSILAHLNQDLANICTTIDMFENDTKVTSSDGLEPNSIEVVCDYTQSAENDLAIAQCIFNNKAAGITTHLDSIYGVSVSTVKDDDGNSRTINFSKVNVLNAYVRLTITKSTETPFPANGVDIIRTAVYTLGLSEMSRAGRDFLVQPFLACGYAAGGVSNVAAEISTDGIDYYAYNIQISPRQKLSFANTDTRIIIVVN
jgi:hypothetical protein